MSHIHSMVDKVQHLRAVSNKVFVTTEQVLRFVDEFTESLGRVEVVVMFHRRVIDLENYLKAMMEKLRNGGKPKSYGEDEVPSIEDDQEINAVLSRIGWLNMYNPFDADIMYRLDLSEKDQHHIAEALVDLAVTEPGENWQGESLDGREFELPSTWIKQVPVRGFLEVHYHTDHTSEETVKSRLKRGDNFDTRMRWLKRVLIWQPGMTVEDRGFEGDRETWSDQKSWVMTRPKAAKRRGSMYTISMKRFLRVGWRTDKDEEGNSVWVSPGGVVYNKIEQVMFLLPWLTPSRLPAHSVPYTGVVCWCWWCDSLCGPDDNSECAQALEAARAESTSTVSQAVESVPSTEAEASVLFRSKMNKEQVESMDEDDDDDDYDQDGDDDDDDDGDGNIASSQHRSMDDDLSGSTSHRIERWHAFSLYTFSQHSLQFISRLSGLDMFRPRYV